MSTVHQPSSSAPTIDPATSLGPVNLTVSDLARSREFYEQVVGLSGVDQDDGSIALSPEGGPALVVLFGDASAPALDRGATGLFHLAILQPSRRDLALSLARIAAARWPLDGASDHLVSEALYLSDPDGNGIEIYRDRPREEWRTDGSGQLQMATIRLDLDDLISAADGTESLPPRTAAGTRIGHVHLQVADLSQAESFYSGVLGFEVMVRGYPGALFVAAGGYHHHLGLNTWHSAGSGPPPAGSVGLRSYEIVLPGRRELDNVLERVRHAGLAVEPLDGDGAHLLRDPFGIGVVLRAAR